MGYHKMLEKVLKNDSKFVSLDTPAEGGHSGRTDYEQQVFTIVHLSFIPGIGYGIINAIIDYCSHNQIHLNDIYHFSLTDFTRINGIYPLIAQKLIDGLALNQVKKLAQDEIETAHKNNVEIITLLDPTYPFLLKNIHLPPPILYIKGKPLETSSKRIGFVGSRDANGYAQKTIDLLIPDLVQSGWHIVSGGAFGADSLAHEATVKAGGTTVVVFGTGILNYYPKKNTQMFDRILEKGGTLVSCFPLNALPTKGSFPERNRIISGLSKGTVVVQAAQKSGALITAQFALEQNRSIFAVPGSIFDELSAGCHSLIKQGAITVTDINDILAEFGEVITPAQVAQESNSSILDGLPVQNKILSYLEEQISLDELAIKTGLSMPELQSELFSMQLEGKVKQNFAWLWHAVNG